jgi:hypothetical protein
MTEHQKNIYRPFLDAYFNNETYKTISFIAMEYMDGYSSLHEVQREYQSLPKCITYFKILVWFELIKLYDIGYTHGDLHLGNILIDNNSNYIFDSNTFLDRSITTGLRGPYIRCPRKGRAIIIDFSHSYPHGNNDFKDLSLEEKIDFISSNETYQDGQPPYYFEYFKRDLLYSEDSENSENSEIRQEFIKIIKILMEYRDKRTKKYIRNWPRSYRSYISIEESLNRAREDVLMTDNLDPNDIRLELPPPRRQQPPELPPQPRIQQPLTRGQQPPATTTIFPFFARSARSARIYTDKTPMIGGNHFENPHDTKKLSKKSSKLPESKNKLFSWDYYRKGKRDDISKKSGEESFFTPDNEYGKDMKLTNEEIKKILKEIQQEIKETDDKILPNETDDKILPNETYNIENLREILDCNISYHPVILYYEDDDLPSKATDKQSKLPLQKDASNDPEYEIRQPEIVTGGITKIKNKKNKRHHFSKRVLSGFSVAAKPKMNFSTLRSEKIKKFNYLRRKNNKTKKSIHPGKTKTRKNKKYSSRFNHLYR